VRIAQEIILQYIDIRQVATKLTHSQTAIHAQYAKTIRKTVTKITTATTIATVMMKITTVNMTEIRFIAIAMIQATNDNYRH
jgi:hypothetical protein